MFVIIVYICFEFLSFFVFLDLFRRIESQLVLLAQEAALKTDNGLISVSKYHIEAVYLKVCYITLL